MSCILKGMTSYTHVSPKLFCNFKKDTLLSARLLESTNNLTHGIFLGDGGSYTKRLYYHELGEVNAKENLIKARSPSMDQGSARKLMNTFLHKIDDTKTDLLYTEKPKCFATKESTKDTTGNECWQNRGQKPIATEEEVEAFKDEIFKIEANTMSEGQIEALLNKKKHKQAAEKNNFSPSPITQSTLGSKLLAKLVCPVEGVDAVYPINPDFITSTDDTVVYVTDVNQENDSATMQLALCDTDQESCNMKSKNYFVTSHRCNKFGIRVKLRCTFAANVNSASIYIIISGLKEAEMPVSIYPNGFHVEEVEGLSQAVAVDLSVLTPGYVVFVRSRKSFTDGTNGNEDESNDDKNEERSKINNEGGLEELGTGMKSC
eukprot:13671354-Ditylum_brightwellii.AAC.1